MLERDIKEGRLKMDGHNKESHGAVSILEILQLIYIYSTYRIHFIHCQLEVHMVVSLTWLSLLSMNYYQMVSIMIPVLHVLYRSL